MSRSHQNRSTVFNNYIMIPFIAREVTGNSETDNALADIWMPAGFRASHIQFFSLGHTNNVTAQLSNVTAGVGIASSAAVPTGSPVQIATPQLNQVGRDIPKGNQIQFRVTTDGTGDTVAGGICARLTGYFTEPISNKARFMESGQSAGKKPRSGFYCILPFRNQRAGIAAQRVEDRIIAPFDCKAMAIQYSVLGQTAGTSILADIYNTTRTLALQDADADIRVSPEQCVDVDSTIALDTDDDRTINRGDLLDLRLTLGAGSVVPIGTLTANLLVWVQGHVNVDPNTED